MSGQLILEKEWDGIRYYLVASGKNRGEIRIKTKDSELVIPSFPHIKRIFNLKNGFKKFKDGKAFVEEKIDGYNVRAIWFDGKVLGFTRGGILCPFTTEKLNDDKKLVKFMRENPDIIVNGEMAGPNNPYISQSPGYIREDVQFFVFDMMLKGNFLSVEDRMDLVKEYGLRGARCFGYMGYDEILEVVEREKENIEGIVMKSKDRKLALKYVFPRSDIDDIRDVSRIFPEVNAGYFLQRLVRSAMFMDEHNLNPDDYARDIGDAFLRGLLDIIRKIKEGKEVYEDYTIIVKNPKTAYDLVQTVSKSRSVRLDVVDIQKKRNKFYVTIRKIYPKATKYWRERLHGKAFID